MAKSENNKLVSASTSASVSVSAEKKTGLENALEHVKNPKARAAIKRALEKKKLKEKEKQPEVKTDEQIVASDKAALAIGFGGSDTLSSVTQALKLAITGKYGSTITWTSSNTAVISNDGKTVVPSTNSDVKVLLTATITKNNITTTKVFEVTVKAKLTDAQIVIADKAALAIGFGGSDDTSFVTSPLTLPAKGANGSVISWISSNPAIISNDGKTVIRPVIGQGDAVVTMIARIKSNGVTDTKLFTLVVKQQLNDADKVAADKAALSITFTEGESAGSVTSKLTLPTLGVNGSTITWVSSAPAAISNDGKTVTRPAAGQGDIYVTLIATITSNGVSDLKTFSVVVKQQLTDAQKMAADKAALQIGFSGTDTSGSVTLKLSLPVVGVNGSTIVWYSSNTAIIADNGTVIRPAAGTGDKTVTLSAVIISNASVDTKAFTVTVKQLP
ncbi:immunoglobulin-like domain-containing protein [Cohnella sp.]|uniref:immunoglobulin-like domain-containing protein n=1 Tax=Cohnella sp. TaxID=1883426 RepID=UPI003569890A